MQSERPSHSGPTLSKGLVAGALGGLIATFAMSKFHSLLSRAESHSQQGKEDSTAKVASALSRTLIHHELTPDQKKIGGSVVHYGFGTAMAALYGALVEFRDSVSVGWGLPFGVAVWFGAHVVAVPALGLSEPVTSSTPATEATEFAAHLVYGAMAESLRKLLRKYCLGGR